MSVPYDRAVTLLKTADLAKQWPNLRALHDLAMAELVDMASNAADDLAAIAKKRADEEAKAAAEAQAKAVARAKADEQARAAGEEQRLRAASRPGVPHPTDVRTSGEGQSPDNPAVTAPTAPPVIERREP